MRPSLRVRIRIAVRPAGYNCAQIQMKQLTLDDARKPTGRGGWRPRAGRPRGRRHAAHERREAFKASQPLHVTLRVVDGVGSLRREPVVDVVREVIRVAGNHEDFRVVQFNVLGNHLHFVVEAGGANPLARRMQGMVVRLARRINRVVGRRGKLFAERYHARALRSPREVRNALRYVLLNARHHSGQALARGWVDPFSSGAWFDGWAGPMRTDQPWMRRLVRMRSPAAAPRTWLLAEGWRRGGGPIAFDDVPGRRSGRPS
jgi:REP element-mobilizing transposase RayT